MVEQPLCLVRGQVTSVLGEGPSVLPWQVADQPGQVLPGLSKRLYPGEAGLQPVVQVGQIRCRSRALYDGGRSRLVDLLRHNSMIMGRLLP
jgi:hypothetical protein